MPDGIEQVNTTLRNVGSHPRMSGIKVAHSAAGVTGENGNGRVLLTFAIFAAQIEFESGIARAKEAQLVPTSRSSVGAQSRQIGSCDHREVKILSEVVGDAIEAIDPCGAHGAGLRLLFPEHEVVHDERAIGFGEEFTEANGPRRRITGIEIVWALLKRIVLNRSTLGEIAAQLGHAFSLAHELDFGKAKRLALG